MWLLIIITIISIFTVLILWFHKIWSELSYLKRGIENAKRQINLHYDLMIKSSTEPELSYAHSKLVLSKKLYNEAVRQYNMILRKPYCFITAWLLGFKTEQQVEEN